MVYVPHRKKFYSVEVPNTETATSGPIRRFPDGEINPQLAYDGCYTIYELFRRSVAVYPHRPFLGHRPIDSEGNAAPYVFESYEEAARRVDHLASALEHEDLCPATPDGLRLLGLYMKNCPEWILADQAAFTIHGATVPLYDTLGPDAVGYIIQQTELSTVVCGPQELENLVAAAPKCPSLKAAVLICPVLSDHHRALARKGGLKLYSLLDLEKLGFRYPQPHLPPDPEDVATFSYTSGTTGGPKGALLTHRNFLTVYCAGKALEVENFPDDIHFSYLPLPHVFERVMLLAVLGNGAAMGFWQGAPEKLVDDMQALRPTCMPAVPRVLNRMYDKVMAGVRASSPLKQALFQRAYAAKLRDLEERCELSKGVWDKLVFAKVRRAIGLDRMRVMVTGSAPIAPHVLQFMRVLCACPIHEGYGQTETTAMTSLTFPGDWTTGHVGGVAPVSEVRLVDVPEMGYLHTDRQHGGSGRGGGGGAGGAAGKPAQPCIGRGEICVRGPHVFKGYYKQPDKTAEAVDAAGWLHSGDVGMWTPEGRLVIIDRKKNIFKLAQGEYVAAEKIENVLMQSEMVAQAFVYGDSLKSELVAIVVPDAEAVHDWARAEGLPADLTFPELCRQPLLKETILDEIELQSKRAGLHGFEIPKAVYLESEAFTGANDLLTPTQKLKRMQARDRYAAIIQELYAKREKSQQSRL